MGKKRKLLIISDNFPPPFNGGGSTIAIQHFLLLKNYFEVKVLTTFYMGDPQNENNREILRYLTPKEIWKDNRHIKTIFNSDKAKIVSLLNNLQPDIILNLHLWNICAETVCFLSNIKIPQVYRFGDEWFKFHIINSHNKLKDGWIDFNPDCLKIHNCIVNSEELKIRVSRFFPNSKVHLIRNYVDTKKFKFNYKKVKFPLTLVYVGRVVEHKGVHICIETLNILKQRFPNKQINLHIYGPTHKQEYFETLKRLINKLSLNTSVFFEGNIRHDNVPKVLKDGNILLFPSLPRSNKTIEGCPNILLEAMSSGIPIISTYQDSLKEILFDEKNCFIAKPLAESFSSKIEYLISHPNETSFIINNAYNYVEQNHSKSNYIKNYLEIFRNIIY